MNQKTPYLPYLFDTLLATQPWNFSFLRYLRQILDVFCRPERARDYEISQNWRRSQCHKTKTVKYWEGALSQIIHNIITYVHAKFQVNTSKFWGDVFLERDFSSGPVRRRKKRIKPPWQNEQSEKDEIFRGYSLKANCGTCAKKSNQIPCICVKLWFAIIPHFHIIEAPPEVHFT